MLCYAMLCYGMGLCYVMVRALCYVMCIVSTAGFTEARAAHGERRHAAELESDGTRCVDLPKVTWRRDGGGGAICVRQQKRGRANTRRTGGEVV